MATGGGQSLTTDGARVNEPRGLALHGGFVYFLVTATAPQSRLVRVLADATSPGPESVTDVLAGDARNIVIDPPCLYWALDGSVMHMQIPP